MLLSFATAELMDASPIYPRRFYKYNERVWEFLTHPLSDFHTHTRKKSVLYSYTLSLLLRTLFLCCFVENYVCDVVSSTRFDIDGYLRDD